MSRSLVGFCLVAMMAGTAFGKPVKAAWFEKDISPAVGTKLAGYGPNDVSVAQNDALEACGLCVDDGERKVLIVSFDLLGLDTFSIREIRGECAKILGIGPEAVMLSCTHTHEGPHSRNIISKTGADQDVLPGGKTDGLDLAYMSALKKTVYAAVRELTTPESWREALLGFHSTTVDENRNRRFTTADNCASFIAHRRMLHQIATGIADKELGVVALLDPKTGDPLFVLGNYAAHPLSMHAPGRGGYRISADFPGYFRRYVRSETGAAAMFVQGAAGDLVAKGDELGQTAARKTGENLAMAALASVIDIQRNSERFVFAEPRVGGSSKTFKSRIRQVYRPCFDRDELELELQCVALGDVCFIGVPGEIVSELGLEIKWNSPFKRTFVAYCSTGYCGYVLPANLMAAGGYEAQELRFASRDTLKLVATAADAAFDLRTRLFPQDFADVDKYPDNQNLPLVNLPGGVKASKRDNAHAKP